MKVVDIHFHVGEVIVDYFLQMPSMHLMEASAKSWVRREQLGSGQHTHKNTYQSAAVSLTR